MSWLSDSSGRALFELSTRGPQVEERHIVMAEGIVVEVAGADPAERLLERRQLPGGEAEARLLRRRMLGAGLLDLAEGCYGFPPEAPEARVETLAVPTAGRVHRYAVENRRGPEELTSVLELLQARIRSLPPVDRDGDRD